MMITIVYWIGALVVIIFLLLAFPPRRVLNRFQIQPSGQPIFYFRIPSRRTVALTIDDGPDPRSTQRILDVLKRHHVKATFFAIGERASANQPLVNVISDEGHEIGNHDLMDRQSVSVGVERLAADVSMTDILIDPFQKRIARKYAWFRFGGGFYSQAHVEAILAYDAKCQIALGDVYSHDAHVPFPLWVALHALVKIQPGSIVILHEGTWWRGICTAVALNMIIPLLKRRGYTFHTLSEMKEMETEDSKKI